MWDAESREGRLGATAALGWRWGGMIWVANWPAIGKGGRIVSISGIEGKVWVGVG